MTAADKPSPTEVEIKFSLPVGAESMLSAHPALRTANGDSWTTQEEATTYFDTSDHSLAQSGASLRVRRSNGRFIQTLKLRTGENHFSRGEWEWPLTGDRLNLQLLAGTPMASVVGTPCDLIPIFMTEVTRSLRVVHAGDAVIEATLDLGFVKAGEKAEPVRELELELKKGDPATLYRLAEQLQATLPLVLGAESKSDRGWRLVNGRPRNAVKQVDTRLLVGATGADAFRTIVQSTLATLLANQPAAAAGMVEGVHQMRIAVRRLRACLALFRPHLEPASKAHYGSELRRLGQVLGEARDWDVFCTQTLRDAADQGVADRFVASLSAAAERERAKAHDQLAAELMRPALTRTVLGMSAWVEGSGVVSASAAGGALSTPLSHLASELEIRLELKVRRYGRHIERRSEEELHELRKALKKLRYGMEFLAPLHRGDQVTSYLRHCKLLQELLGAINDAAVAAVLVERLSAQDASLALAAEAVKNWTSKHRNKAESQLPAAWHEFRKATFPKVSAS